MFIFRTFFIDLITFWKTFALPICLRFEWNYGQFSLYLKSSSLSKIMASVLFTNCESTVFLFIVRLCLWDYERKRGFLLSIGIFFYGKWTLDFWKHFFWLTLFFLLKLNLLNLGFFFFSNFSPIIGN